MQNYYHPADVLIGAANAYCKSIAGNNDQYVIRKSMMFLDRCLKQLDTYDDITENRIPLDNVKIPKEIVADIAYSALDCECEAALWDFLNDKIFSDNNVLQNNQKVVLLLENLY